MAEAKKVKVLYIVESFSTGVYAIVRDIACALDPDSFEVHILHSLRDDSPSGYEEDLNREHIQLTYIPMGSVKEYPKAVKAIREYIIEFSPDVIHLHSSKAGVLGRLAVPKKVHVPIFYSPHGFSFLREDVGAGKRLIFLTLERVIQVYRKARIIAVSEGEAVHARRITQDVLTINNFIDTSQFESRETEEEEYIVTCGRISPQKQPTLFNEIALQMPDQQFLWIGDGPLRDTLTAENITVTGLVPRTEAIEKVKKAMIYIQTSLWEGMPVSILEAMAAGRAVVASDIVGNRDLITDGVTGNLCEAHHADAFVERIKEFISSEKLRKERGNAAADHVMKNHSLKSAVASYERLYRLK